MKNKMNIKKMVVLSILAAMTVILQVLSLYIKFGPFSATLALVPLIIGAICYGPSAGFTLGFIMGIIILATDAHAFWVINPFYTIIICLVKTSVAGLVSGFAFKALRKYNFMLAVVVAAIIAPIVNTSLFSILCIIFFYNTLQEWAGGSNALNYLFLTMIGINFIIEFSLNSILSPALTYLLRQISRTHDLGLEFYRG